MFFPIIVLDIDNQGIEFISAAQSKVTVFHNMAFHQTGWIDTRSPVLVLLPEGQSCPSQVRETFFAVDEERPSNAYALTIFDTNKDTRIDANDDFYPYLHLWLSRNKDGDCQPSDVFPLSALGITINLDFERVDEWTVEGHKINYSFTFDMDYTDRHGNPVVVHGLQGLDVALHSIPVRN
ncbi:hypothetical protein [Alkalimonas amylolytica]|uniref:Uncharacterized protein n=1 Tax=Alkalimonas amylolytica TaxID=152573 RepID=A0A1H3X2Q3_ALKAM|nr:hypothetical protein [Alkalimonas amylolytica]SDZ92798.1 hypothetical protein SAMN04488051_10146 [Alkalimonas amylolytica]